MIPSNGLQALLAILGKAQIHHETLQWVGIDVGDFHRKLEECREQMTLRCLMWRSLEEWQKYNEEWYKTAFSEINVEKITTLSEKFNKNCIRIEKNLETNPIAIKLKELVTTFKEAMPVVKALSTDKLGTHHWD